MQETILAHPDTLGNIDLKLEFIDGYYNAVADENLVKQQQLGKLRLLAESKVDLKLEEIEHRLEALAVTLQFDEKGGLTQDEVENVKQKYREVLSFIGLEVSATLPNKRMLGFQEACLDDTLMNLIRQWYRAWIHDPNLLNEDELMIREEWELKINLLKRRSQRLWQRISNPSKETRLDDYVIELKR